MRTKSSLPVGRPPGLGNAVKHYKKIAASFTKKINSGSWPEGFQLPSHSQLAAQFKIGEHTIRRALDCLAQEHRIVKTPNSQWKVQNSNLKHSFHAHGVVFITTYWLGAFWSDGGGMSIRKGIEINLARRIKQIRMYYKNNNCTEMRTEMIPSVADADIEGILLYGGFSKKCLQQYSTLHVPVVRVDAPVPVGVRLASISVDNVAAAKDAVLRMVQLGHRRIAFCRAIILSISEIDPDSHARQEGFLAGLEECGIKNGKVSIYNFVSVAGRPNANVAAIDAILNARPRYTAVFCVDAGPALEISEAALIAGLKLPRDLSFVAFDSLGSPLKFAGPRVDFERLGYESVELLESKIVQQVLFPTLWHEGNSLVQAP